MDKLTWEYQQMLNNNRDGSFSTQQSRKEGLFQIAKDLKKMGFNQMSARSLKGKHYERLVDKWKNEGKSAGTMKNLMSYCRWQASKNNLTHRVPSNNRLGIPNRVYATNISKGSKLDNNDLKKVTDENTKLSLRLQAEFGLRRETAIKFNPVISDKGDKISLPPSTTKGGRGYDVPVETQEQRDLLNELKNQVGNNSLIPPDKSYKDQLNTYKDQLSKSGIGKSHPFRHNYAEDRYKQLTGNDCPTRGGMHQRDMSPEQRAVDREARLQISSELGHSREQIVTNYIGS